MIGGLVALCQIDPLCYMAELQFRVPHQGLLLQSNALMFFSLSLNFEIIIKFRF